MDGAGAPNKSGDNADTGHETALADGSAAVSEPAASDALHGVTLGNENDELEVLRLFLRHSPDSVMMLNRDRRIVYLNRLEMGFTKDQVLGQSVELFVQPDDKERVRAAIDGVFMTGKATSYDVELHAPSGHYWFTTRVRPIYVDGVVSNVSLVSTDITEAKLEADRRLKEQQELQQSEERFRTLVENAPEALVIFDPATGKFNHVNPRACEFFQATREELMQRSPAELSPMYQPDGSLSSEKAQRVVAEALAGQQPEFEWMHCTLSGEELPCEVRLVRLPQGNTHMVRGSIIDISERRRAEQERTRLQEQLFQAQKTQAIGQLTGGVAHDFNNLLTIIMSHTELLEVDAEETVLVLDHAKEILAAAERAAALTQQLLAFARRQPLQPKLVNVQQLLERTEVLLKRTLGETIDIATEVAAQQWLCEVDPTQLENALLNLAINARDAMPTGGKLVLRASNIELESGSAPDGSTVPAGQYAAISVEDNGCGIPQETLSHVFEPFFTTKDVGKGSGLGLSMVYGFVKQSGGHIEIHSRQNHGTRVDIFLPRALQKQHGNLTFPELEPGSLGQGQIILVVEDEEAVRKVTVKRLLRMGYQTLEAPDADLGLRLLEHRSDISLLLTDIVLPGKFDGVALSVRAHKLRPDLPIVFMSGYPDAAFGTSGQLPPGARLLRKPFGGQVLERELQSALESRSTLPA